MPTKLQRAERRRRSFSSKVPWLTPLRGRRTPPGGEPGPYGLVLCKDKQALMRVYGVRGLDSSGDDPETIGVRMLQANQALMGLHGPWTLHAEAQGQRFANYPTGVGRFRVPALIDADRAQALTDPEAGCWETQYFVALTWEPPQGQRGARAYFLKAADNFMSHLRVVLADMEPLEDEALFTCLHSTVSCHWHPVGVPMPQQDLSRYLVDSAWQAGNYPDWDATLGRHHVRVLTLTGYPRRSSATMMERLEQLGIPLRWSTRWQEIAPHLQDKQLQRMQEDWLSQEKSVTQRVREGGTGKAERVISEDAIRKTEELSLARQDIGAGFYGLGNSGTTVITWGDTAEVADMRAQQVRHTLEGLGFVVRREGDYGARTPLGNWLLQWLAPPHHTAAFLGAMPGNRTDNSRRGFQSTLAATHLLPGLRSVWPGPLRDEHLQGPPWFLAQTAQSALTRICHYVRDVGHSLLLGNTGAGKSTFVLFAMAQWLHRYAQTQGTIFDVGRSARLLTLLCEGGRWVDLSTAQTPLQPLRDIDHPGELRWALTWLLGIAARAQVRERDGLLQEYVKERLDALARRPHEQRTMTGLLHLCEAHSVRVEARVTSGVGTRTVSGLSQPNPERMARLSLHRAFERALRPFCLGGEYGGILDGVEDTVVASPLVTFEQGGMVKTSALLEPVSQYCFHLTEQRFDTRRPMWLVMEEAPLMAVMPHYKEQFDAWLMTIRKSGASLALVVNSLEQAAQMGLGLLTSENTPHRWYFPNPEALTTQTGKVYDLFGLTAEEKRVIATARMTRDVYYVCRERGRRLLQIPLSRFILDCVARNTDADHELMDKLLEREGREGFRDAWLREHGYGMEGGYEETKVV